MDFSDIYITGGQSFVCVESNKDLFTSLEDANNADYQIGAQVGSIQADLAHENTPDADIIELSKVPDIIAELVTGKLDGAFIETMVAESYATQYPELCLVLEVPYDAEGSVVGVTKGNAALLEGVNRAIAAAKEDGSFDQYVLTANELASGDIIEGLVDETARPFSKLVKPSIPPCGCAGRNWPLSHIFWKDRRRNRPCSQPPVSKEPGST